MSTAPTDNHTNLEPGDQTTVQEDEIKQIKNDEVSYILETSRIDDKRSKFLAKKNEYKVIFDDGKEETFKRKPLSSRKNKEIDDLRSSFIINQRGAGIGGGTTTTTKIKVNGKVFDNANDLLFEAYRLTAIYCLGMTDNQYDSAIWEDEPEYMDKGIYGLRSILTACLLRAVHGVAYFPQP